MNHQQATTSAVGAMSVPAMREDHGDTTPSTTTPPTYMVKSFPVGPINNQSASIHIPLTSVFAIEKSFQKQATLY